jgi:hypothetical protein
MVFFRGCLSHPPKPNCVPYSIYNTMKDTFTLDAMITKTRSNHHNHINI